MESFQLGPKNLKFPLIKQGAIKYEMDNTHATNIDKINCVFKTLQGPYRSAQISYSLPKVSYIGLPVQPFCHYTVSWPMTC